MSDVTHPNDRTLIEYPEPARRITAEQQAIAAHHSRAMLDQIAELQRLLADALGRFVEYPDASPLAGYESELWHAIAKLNSTSESWRTEFEAAE